MTTDNQKKDQRPGTGQPPLPCARQRTAREDPPCRSGCRPGGGCRRPRPDKPSSPGPPAEKKQAVPATPVKLTMLGGLNEIGKNITLFEYGDDAFLIDCGMAFPDDEMLGVDIVLPRFHLCGEEQGPHQGHRAHSRA